jgi:hypothetical protein
MPLKTFASVAVLSLAIAAAPAAADSVGHASRGSAYLSLGSGVIVAGAASMVVGSGQLIVEAIETTGDSIIVVVRSASQAGIASLRITREAADAASLSVGSAIEVLGESTGHALTAAGRLIAFLPNELGRSLLYHASYTEGY